MFKLAAIRGSRSATSSMRLFPDPTTERLQEGFSVAAERPEAGDSVTDRVERLGDGCNAGAGAPAPASVP